MKKLQLILLVVILLCFVTESFEQKRNYQIMNGLSITGPLQSSILHC